MGGCFVWLLIAVGGIVVIMSLIRWFEQTAEAVRNRWWNKTVLLVLFPPAAWFFPGRISAGRPTPVPLHTPVRGFGSAPKEKVGPAASSAEDQPPPGTPAEFLVKPQVPPKKPSAKPAVDAEKLAKLREKMREQGMLGGNEDGTTDDTAEHR